MNSPRATPHVLSACAAACIAVIPACTIDSNAPPPVIISLVDPASGAPGAPTDTTDAAWPFAPRSLRIHPLTHVDVTDPTGAGAAVLILHVELRDRFGDSVKGVGVLSVELSRDVAGAVGATPETRAQWSITDIGDPGVGSRRFDPATRTYRVPLKAPQWVSRWMTDEGERRGGPQSLTLRASFAPAVGEDRRVLTDEFLVEP